MNAWFSVVLSVMVVRSVADVGTSTDISEETVVNSLGDITSLEIIVVSLDTSVVFAFDCAVLVIGILADGCCEIIGFDCMVCIVDGIGVSVVVVCFLVVIASVSLVVGDSSVLKRDIVMFLVCRIICVGCVLIVLCSVAVSFRPVITDVVCSALIDICVEFAVVSILLACLAV